MSPSPHDKNELQKVSSIIGNLIRLDAPGLDLLPQTSLRDKVDLLERVIESWRFHNHCPGNALDLEDFVQGELFVDDETVHFRLPETLRGLGSGTPPIRLQPRLLLFLLLYHRQAYAIYDIIEKFIGKVWDELTLLDFKKTQTGVTRCFTNTRFAANVLREYGLLKFTHKEAYKTWVLSLPGFLVASRIIQDGIEWGLPSVVSRWKLDLHPAICKAREGMETFDQFVGRLAYACEPNVEVFKTFEKVLVHAHRLLNSYWAAMSDPKLGRKERRLETSKRLKELEETPGMDEFYREYSACVNVERLLADNGPPSPK